VPKIKLDINSPHVTEFYVTAIIDGTADGKLLITEEKVRVWKETVTVDMKPILRFHQSGSTVP
jgi:hypothetical protein